MDSEMGPEMSLLPVVPLWILLPNRVRRHLLHFLFQDPENAWETPSPPSISEIQSTENSLRAYKKFLWTWPSERMWSLRSLSKSRLELKSKHLTNLVRWRVDHRHCHIIARIDLK